MRPDRRGATAARSRRPSPDRPARAARQPAARTPRAGGCRRATTRRAGHQNSAVVAHAPSKTRCSIVPIGRPRSSLRTGRRPTVESITTTHQHEAQHERVQHAGATGARRRRGAGRHRRSAAGSRSAGRGTRTTRRARRCRRTTAASGRLRARAGGRSWGTRRAHRPAPTCSSSSSDGRQVEVAAAAPAAVEAGDGDAAMAGAQPLVASDGRPRRDAPTTSARGPASAACSSSRPASATRSAVAVADAAASSSRRRRIERGDGVDELGLLLEVRRAPGRRGRCAVRRASTARASAPPPPAARSTVFNCASSRVRCAVICSPSRSRASIASSSSSARSALAARRRRCSASASAAARARRPLGEVGAPVRQLVDERVDALQFEQVVGQHARTTAFVSGVDGMRGARIEDVRRHGRAAPRRGSAGSRPAP